MALYASIVPHFTRELVSPGVHVGYTDEGGVWQFVAPFISQRLPLRAIEWRNLVGVLKRIDHLPLTFVEIACVSRTLPMACMYLVQCEDLEHYKNVVRPSLRRWVDAMNTANVEWLVLYVPLGTRAKAATNGPHLVYKKILDRLRMDFASRKPSRLSSGVLGSPLTLLDRVCQLDTFIGTSVLGQPQQYDAQYTDLLLCLKHCVMEAFQNKCIQYETQVKILQGKRHAVGWNFGTFFKTKETLALLYQQMNLQDDAIRHVRRVRKAYTHKKKRELNSIECFDELDAVFGNLTESEMQSFPDNSVLAKTIVDALFTLSPLALPLHEILDVIAANHASSRLIALYSFCRQIRLLYVMKSFPQLLERAHDFIPSFLTDLRHLATTKTLEWHQPALWAVAACLEIASACERSYTGRDNKEYTTTRISDISIEEMARALGTVVYLARCILKTYVRTPCPIPSDRTVTVPTSWYHHLDHMFVHLSNHNTLPFEQCIVEISHLASMHFSHAKRYRFAMFLDHECAQYYLQYNTLSTASSLLRSIAQQSHTEKWWRLYFTCMHQLCRTELARNQWQDAVVAWFQMIQVVSENHVETSHTDLFDVIPTLVTAHCTNVAIKQWLSVFIQPKLNLTIIQSKDNVLEKYDVCGTVAFNNVFAVTIFLDCVWMCFQRKETEVYVRMEEKSVQLKEMSSRILEWTHCGVNGGQYMCMEVACSIGGRVFSLLPNDQLACFDFQIHEVNKSIQVAIVSPSVLIPPPFALMEFVLVSIETHEERLEKGRLIVQLESPILRAQSPNELEKLETGVQLMGCGVVHEPWDSTSLSKVVAKLQYNTFQDNSDWNRTSVVVPLVPRGTRAMYVVALGISRLDSNAWKATIATRNETSIGLQARVEYCREMHDVTYICHSDRVFQVCEPLTAVVRLSRVGSRVFVSIVLTCNPFESIIMKDYNILLEPNAILTIHNDRNGSLRGSKVQVQDCVAFAFTLASTLATKDNVELNVTCSFVLSFYYTNDLNCLKTMHVAVPIHEIQGTGYQIKVQQLVQHENQDDTSGIRVSDVLVYQVDVCEEESLWPQDHRDNVSTIKLYLDTSSEVDWILLGKQHEGFTLDFGGHFCTQKRLVPTRSGSLRFPAFRLEKNGQAIASSRVYCPQKTRRVLVQDN
ncbi:hypothetical protein CCR75_000559 [Bremia lactucae]|uniref:TRAPPC10/Trs130 N-terminal domain-containing protein n=1 Tax=Bremia lactucae TaxID=4779 RepID=A0A976IJF5_BRELC|nr:hypothetical protein CCR75_000559 [Bremia lactucae]